MFTMIRRLCRSFEQNKFWENKTLNKWPQRRNKKCLQISRDAQHSYMWHEAVCDLGLFVGVFRFWGGLLGSLRCVFVFVFCAWGGCCFMTADNKWSLPTVFVWYKKRDLQIVVIILCWVLLCWILRYWYLERRVPMWSYLWSLFFVLLHLKRSVLLQLSYCNAVMFEPSDGIMNALWQLWCVCLSWYVTYLL